MDPLGMGWNRNKVFLIKWSFVFAFLLIVILSIKLIFTNDNNQDKTLAEFMLFGDSLIERTDVDYRIAKKIENALKLKYPLVNIAISTCAKGGSRILDLRNRVNKCMLNRPKKYPIGLIIYWDSDSTDIDFSLALTKSVLERYKNNLIFTLTELIYYIPYIAVAGPTLDGELPRGLNKRDNILDVYEGNLMCIG